MRFPAHLLHSIDRPIRTAMAAIAAVAIGMFVGTWVIGPAITHDIAETPRRRRRSGRRFEDMVARPDPMPYRAATPAFDMPGPPHYAAAAKEKAQAELGGDDRPSAEFARRATRATHGYDSRAIDRVVLSRRLSRHRVY